MHRVQKGLLPSGTVQSAHHEHRSRSMCFCCRFEMCCEFQLRGVARKRHRRSSPRLYRIQVRKNVVSVLEQTNPAVLQRSPALQASASPEVPSLSCSSLTCPLKSLRRSLQVQEAKPSKISELVENSLASLVPECARAGCRLIRWSSIVGLTSSLYYVPSSPTRQGTCAGFAWPSLSQRNTLSEKALIDATYGIQNNLSGIPEQRPSEPCQQRFRCPGLTSAMPPGPRRPGL